MKKTTVTLLFLLTYGIVYANGMPEGAEKGTIIEYIPIATIEAQSTSNIKGLFILGFGIVRESGEEYLVYMEKVRPNAYTKRKTKLDKFTEYLIIEDDSVEPHIQREQDDKEVRKGTTRAYYAMDANSKAWEDYRTYDRVYVYVPVGTIIKDFNL